MSVRQYIDELRTSIGLSYLDVVCCKKHEIIFRHISGENATGKESLYMYSCGKVVTVTAALRLIEEGRLGLDDRVCDYLPSIKKAFILNENNEKEYVGEQMAVRHLFTMTAGFTYDVYTQPILDLAKESEGKATLQDFIPKFVETPLSFAPGARFQYSLCHDVLAAVVEVVTGKKFSQYIKEIIFDPLGMEHSRFDNGEDAIADVYAVQGDGSINLTKKDKILLPTRAYESGGAGMVSTVEDYIRFADALACGGKAKGGYQVLKQSTLELLTSRQVTSMSVNNGFTCVQGEDYAYGLGVRVRQKATEWGLKEGEFGWDGAAGSYVMIDPHQEIAVFIGMHLLEWPTVFNGKHLAIVKKLYEEIFPM